VESAHDARMLDAKRAFDLAASALAAIVFAPVMPLVTAAVCIDDGLPLLFVQERIGRDRKAFRVLKLRTMRNGRVTRVGRWLRATGLDELPQFVNVVRGEMSVVGPRPLTREDLGRLRWDTAEHDRRFDVRPGIVGLAQVIGGRTARHTAKLDALYARRASLSVDASMVALGFVSNVVGKTRMRVLRRLVLGLGPRPLITKRRPLTRRTPSTHGCAAQSALP